MLPRLTPLVRSAAALSRVHKPSQVIRCMSAATNEDWKSDIQIHVEARATYNDLPIPEGDFEEWDKARNAKWSIMCGTSVVLTALTFFGMYKSGVLYFHGRPNFKDICID